MNQTETERLISEMKWELQQELEERILRLLENTRREVSMGDMVRIDYRTDGEIWKGIMWYDCPKCNFHWIHEDSSYCGRCGRKIEYYRSIKNPILFRKFR